MDSGKAETEVQEDSQEDWEACIAALNMDLPGYAACERSEMRPPRFLSERLR